MDRSDSHIEIRGFTARHYDLLMDILTLGLYRKFIKSAIKAMEIKRGDRILDLGAGTGRNACIMREYVGDAGEIIALEIGEEMIK
ncbi:MAG: class I SAM-dependent methyltransferase, partial [Candidatus Hydrothermae bacterium]|nr:class I SAM-dependent methyltransferase [Candidatus Hydrothermae bacterium]